MKSSKFVMIKGMFLCHVSLCHETAVGLDRRAEKRALIL